MLLLVLDLKRCVAGGNFSINFKRELHMNRLLLFPLKTTEKFIQNFVTSKTTEKFMQHFFTSKPTVKVGPKFQYLN